MTTTPKNAVLPALRDQDLLQSGGAGRPINSSRAGLLPISLEHIPIAALEGIPVYIRSRPGDPPPEPSDEVAPPGFTLYCTASVRFAEFHRLRLVDHGVKFVYIRIVDQSRFRRQTEARLVDLTANPTVTVREKSEIIYETSVELMNELLAEPELLVKSPRLEQVSRSITTLVINNPSAFSHLFAVSDHDFYTATHMVNVATWMVPLAYELGYRDSELLNNICLAGLLHDIGKTEVPEAILNKAGKLTEDEWKQIRRHPEAGGEYLKRLGNIHPLVITVARQHHERLDGGGYPDKLRGDQIDPVSRICAVIDSFDAMTAFRPFKERTISVSDALAILQRATPVEYDAQVMEAWMRLMVRAQRDQAAEAADGAASNKRSVGRRRHARKAFQCPGRAHVLASGPRGATERPAAAIVAHNISRGGLAFLTQVPMAPGDFLRIHLQAKGWTDRALEGQVVRCIAHDDSWHEVGVQFGGVPSEDRAAPAQGGAEGR